MGGGGRGWEYHQGKMLIGSREEIIWTALKSPTYSFPDRDKNFQGMNVKL